MKRDLQGKFTLKNDDYREVRSLRLTDATWKTLGIAAECLGLTRADLIEQVIRENNFTFPEHIAEKQPLQSSLLLMQAKIEELQTLIQHLAEDNALLKKEALINCVQQLTALQETVLAEDVPI